MSPQALETLTAAEAKALAMEAFLFGLPPVHLALQADQMTNVSRPVGASAPVNQFGHHREFPEAGTHQALAVNLDTLYSVANLDLSREPYILSIPEMGGRWWSMQAVDAWNEAAPSPGSRLAGGRGGHFALLGPSWSGPSPHGMPGMNLGTALVFLVGRTHVGGRSDMAAVHKLQDRFHLTPLSQWGKPWSPPESVPVKPGVDTRTPLFRLLLSLSAEVFIRRLNALLSNNPPLPEDLPLLERSERIGIRPGAPFSIREFPESVRIAVEDGMEEAKQMILAARPSLGEWADGWQIDKPVEGQGTAYLERAASAYYGMGGTRREDIFQSRGCLDHEGRPLDGSRRYELRFPKDALPPVEGFWSVTLCDAESRLVPNPLNRHALGDHGDLKIAADGSITLHIQSHPPGKGRESNWLPSPEGRDFSLALRLYSPGREVLDGIWKPPAIRRV